MQIEFLNRGSMNQKLTDFLKSLWHICGYFEHEIIPGIETKNLVGDVPLHIAIHQNNSEAVELLLEEGANPNAVGEDGFTPLHSAVAAGNAQAVKLLLNYGALTDIKDNLNYLTPEEFAVRWKREDVLSEFKEFKRTRKK